MNPKAAKLVAELVGGEVMNSGGRVLTVEAARRIIEGRGNESETGQES